MDAICLTIHCIHTQNNRISISFFSPFTSKDIFKNILKNLNQDFVFQEKYGEFDND